MNARIPRTLFSHPGHPQGREGEGVGQLPTLVELAQLRRGEELEPPEDLQVLGFLLTDLGDRSFHHLLRVGEEGGVGVDLPQELDVTQLHARFLPRFTTGNVASHVLQGSVGHGGETLRGFPVPLAEGFHHLVPPAFVLDPLDVVGPIVEAAGVGHAEVTDQPDAALSVTQDDDHPQVLEDHGLVVQPGPHSLGHLPQHDADETPPARVHPALTLAGG